METNQDWNDPSNVAEWKHLEGEERTPRPCAHKRFQPHVWDKEGEIAVECLDCGKVGVYSNFSAIPFTPIGSPTTITKREEILQAAIQCVTKDRQATHGKPENSFADIAYLWSWYKGIEFTPQETAVMMALMKMARIKGNHTNDDNFIDLSGYCALAAELKPQ